MEKKFFIKIGRALMMFLAVIFIIIANENDVYASTQYTDTEDNNSIEKAQFVQKNMMSYSHKVSGNYSYYNYVKGTLSGDDEDWYYVYLGNSTDDIYLTMSGGMDFVYIDILNPNKELIQTFIYKSTTNCENVFKVDNQEPGYYYIRLYHKFTNLDAGYSFTVGEPEYLLGSYTHKFGTMTLEAKGVWEDKVDLSLVDSIPKDAIGYKITVSGCSSSITSDRYYYTVPSGWVATKRIGNYYDLPVVESSKLAQVWGVRYKSSDSDAHQFIPQFIINYVYPDLPEN